MIGRLREPRPEVRQAAVRALAQLGLLAVPSLLQELSGQDEAARLGADALVRIEKFLPDPQLASPGIVLIKGTLTPALLPLLRHAAAPVRAACGSSPSSRWARPVPPPCRNSAMPCGTRTWPSAATQTRPSSDWRATESRRHALATGFEVRVCGTAWYSKQCWWTMSGLSLLGVPSSATPGTELACPELFTRM